MRTSALRSFLAEPRAPHPPGPLRRDWVLVAAVLTAGLLEVLLRDDVAWPGVVALTAVAPAVCLPWRRSHPVRVTAAVFGSIALGDAALLVGTGEPHELFTSLYVLLVAYAVFRWGSGVEAATGVALVLVWNSAIAVAGGTPVGEVALGIPVLLLPVALGASMRYRARSRVSEHGQIRLREREQLARELHDTVAHHVSAIAIRAQAGRATAASRPEAAVEALAVIEEAASRTLADMRSLVGTLRDGEEAALAPQGGVRDLQRLARGHDGGPRVDVRLAGDLDHLPPLVDAAVYRIAQESITNAVRHARQATLVDVRVTGDRDCVRLSVRDDGDASPSGTDRGSGYGLIGMTERAALLGGTLQTGAGDDGGWTVTAVLPRSASTR
ncbi:MAG TPA: sensor histidine kinase [Solirubrobacteraceae bacterium]